MKRWQKTAALGGRFRHPFHQSPTRASGRFNPFFGSGARSAQRASCQTGPNAWHYTTSTVPIPLVQLMFTHQLNVVVASPRFACDSQARIFSCTRTTQLGRTQLNRQDRQDDLSITTSVYL